MRPSNRVKSTIPTNSVCGSFFVLFFKWNKRKRTIQNCLHTEWNLQGRIQESNMIYLNKHWQKPRRIWFGKQTSTYVHTDWTRQGRGQERNRIYLNKHLQKQRRIWFGKQTFTYVHTDWNRQGRGQENNHIYMIPVYWYTSVDNRLFAGLHTRRHLSIGFKHAKQHIYIYTDT